MEEIDISRLKRRKPDFASVKAPPSLFPGWGLLSKADFRSHCHINPSYPKDAFAASTFDNTNVLILQRGVGVEYDDWNFPWTVTKPNELALQLCIVWRSSGEVPDDDYSSHSVIESGWYLESNFFFNWAGSYPLLTTDPCEQMTVLIRKAETRIGHFLSLLGTTKPGLLPIPSYHAINNLLHREEDNQCDAATCVRVIANTLKNTYRKQE